MVDKYLSELETQLAKKHVSLHVDNTARTWFAQHGYDKAMGARPMARLIQEKIKKPIADELLFGRLIHGGQLLVTSSNDSLQLIIHGKGAAMVNPTPERLSQAPIGQA